MVVNDRQRGADIIPGFIVDLEARIVFDTLYGDPVLEIHHIDVPGHQFGDRLRSKLEHYTIEFWLAQIEIRVCFKLHHRFRHTPDEAERPVTDRVSPILPLGDFGGIEIVQQVFWIKDRPVAGPRPVAYRYIKGLIDNGLGKRLMYGSDQMIWPEIIGETIEAIEIADFRTEEQKREPTRVVDR